MVPTKHKKGETPFWRNVPRTSAEPPGTIEAPIESLFSKRVALVTGKGGVGRTTVSAAMAVAAAKKGKRVLLTEIGDPDGDYTALARVFGRDTLPREPTRLIPGVEACMLFAQEGHERFFRTVLPSKALVRAAMSSGPLRRLMESAPSFREMGIFYHFLSLIESTLDDGRRRYDMMIVDMPASGHTLGLTGLPERILPLLPTGPIADAMRKGQLIMYNPTDSGAIIVTLPETLPVSESLELMEGLTETNVPLSAVIANRVVRDPFSKKERAVVNQWSEEPLFGMRRFLQIPQIEESLVRLDGATNAAILEVDEQPLQGRELVNAIADILVEIG